MCSPDKNMYVGTDHRLMCTAHTPPLSIRVTQRVVLLGHACLVLCYAVLDGRTRAENPSVGKRRRTVVHGKPCGPRASIKSRCSHCSNSLLLVIRSPGKSPSPSAIRGVDGAAPTNIEWAVRTSQEEQCARTLLWSRIRRTTFKKVSSTFSPSFADVSTKRQPSSSQM